MLTGNETGGNGEKGVREGVKRASGKTQMGKAREVGAARGAKVYGIGRGVEGKGRSSIGTSIDRQ